MVESFSEGETKQILDINGRRELVGKGDGKGRGLVGRDHICGEQGREKEIRNGSGQLQLRILAVRDMDPEVVTSYSQAGLPLER